MVKDSTPIPVINEMDAIAVANQKQISEIGAPSTIARVDSKSGMLLLPFGQEKRSDAGNGIYSMEG